MNKQKFRILVGNIYNALIFNNKLQINYFYKKKIKYKNIYFKNQNICLDFHKLLKNVFNHFVINYLD